MLLAKFLKIYSLLLVACLFTASIAYAETGTCKFTLSVDKTNISTLKTQWNTAVAQIKLYEVGNKKMYSIKNNVPLASMITEPGKGIPFSVACEKGRFYGVYVFITNGPLQPANQIPPRNKNNKLIDLCGVYSNMHCYSQMDIKNSPHLTFPNNFFQNAPLVTLTPTSRD